MNDIQHGATGTEFAALAALSDLRRCSICGKTFKGDACPGATKAYWRSEQRHREKWEAEHPMTDAARAYGAYLIAQERVQGFAAGWIAGVAWAKREHSRSNAQHHAERPKGAIA